MGENGGRWYGGAGGSLEGGTGGRLEAPSVVDTMIIYRAGRDEDLEAPALCHGHYGAGRDEWREDLEARAAVGH